MIKSLSQLNRSRLITNLKSRFENLENSIILMKGSNPYHENDSDTTYPSKFEMNFTYLFGLN